MIPARGVGEVCYVRLMRRGLQRFAFYRKHYASFNALKSLISGKMLKSMISGKVLKSLISGSVK
jgi:hypothetical protein